MELHIEPAHIDFRCRSQLVGRYHHGDVFKPYLHPLNTPAGHTLSLAMPHDHKHHKGLMYALRTREINFWEEWPTLPGEQAGRQRHTALLRSQNSGEVVGFEETLRWEAEDGTLPTFSEQRSLYCCERPEMQGYEWSWRTRLRALRDIELVLSQWSHQRHDGARVNYHGLGLRLRRDFGCTGGNRALIDSREMPFTEAMGLQPCMATFCGRLDGSWPAAEAGVTLAQEQADGLFIMERPFAFFALGPSNLAPLQLDTGAEIRAQYRVLVFDGAAPND